MNRPRRPTALLLALLGIPGLALPPRLDACTGIRLRAADGGVVCGRTMEWGEFDLRSRVLIVPRGTAGRGRTPDGRPGLAWTARHGCVGVDAMGRDVMVDGINEAGLAAGAFYHPGFAEYPAYSPAEASRTLASTEVVGYLLATCASVDEARAAMAGVRVADVPEPGFGLPLPLHYMVTDPAGRSLVIEHAGGSLRLFDAPLGVITNAPGYDWHETNLRNYLNLSAVALPDKKLEDLDFRPLGVGSGMIGLPGDFTPVSRFVRAVAFTQSARKARDGGEAIYELFRILDNFNVPAVADPRDPAKTEGGLRSSTLWTTGYDLRDRVFYFHTQNNRRVRRVDLKAVDLSGGPVVHLPMDRRPAQDVEDITPHAPAGR